VTTRRERIRIWLHFVWLLVRTHFKRELRAPRSDWPALEGLDGFAVFDGTREVEGARRVSAHRYVIQRDVFYRHVLVFPDVRLVTAGWRVTVQGLFILESGAGLEFTAEGA
jgi:hypothetical protein